MRPKLREKINTYKQTKPLISSLKYLIISGLSNVGATGFEPTTPCSQSRGDEWRNVVIIKRLGMEEILMLTNGSQNLMIMEGRNGGGLLGIWEGDCMECGGRWGDEKCPVFGMEHGAGVRLAGFGDLC